MSSVMKDSKLRPSTLDARRTLIIWGNLTETTWRNKKYIHLGYWPSFFGQDGWILAKFFFARLWRVVPSGQDGARSGSQSRRAIWFILPAHGAGHIISMGYWPTLFGQDGWILAKFFFFCMFMDRDEVEVYKLAKKNEANIQPSWPNKLGQ